MAIYMTSLFPIWRWQDKWRIECPSQKRWEALTILEALPVHMGWWLMYLWRKTLVLKPKFEANCKANWIQAKCEWIREWM